ncbi:sensor histidine kinase [Paenibacillus sp. CAU 1782]
MNKVTLTAFLKDRMLYMITILFLAGFAVLLFVLENYRYPGLVESGTIFYIATLAVFLLIAWLAADYVRQRHFYKQLREAMERAGERDGVAIVNYGVTHEQKLVVSLLQEQNAAFLNELSQYKRQQELRNHFVLQWVHYMKTPVSVIDMQMQEVMRELPMGEEQQRDAAQSIQEEAERLARGLEQMLHTARLDKFALDLHIRRLPLHEIIRSAVNGHKRLCIKHSIFPRIEGEAWVESDEKWITFVLGQLIGNSIKYSKNKPGSKNLKFRLKESGGGEAALEVEDEGIGIMPHDLPRIFDPFFTGENGRTSGESTGMGLYLAKEVCGRLGHSLSAESQPGSGSVFRLTFKPGGIHVMK